MPGSYFAGAEINKTKSTGDKPVNERELSGSRQAQVGVGESGDIVSGDDLSAHNLLDKKHFIGELKKNKQLFFNGDITRDEYVYRKKDLYVERAIQRGVEIFSSAEEFLLEDPDISSEDLAQKVKQYAQENNLTLSDDQKWMIDRASEMLDKRRQIVVDLLDEVKGVLPEDAEVPQTLEEWDEAIDNSLELKLFILDRVGYSFLGKASDKAREELTIAMENMYKLIRNFITVDSVNGIESNTTYIEYKNVLEVLRQVQLGIYDDKLKAFRLSEKHKDVVPSAIREYFKSIFGNVKISFNQKPLVVTVMVSEESLWGDMTLLGGFIPAEDNSGRYKGMVIDMRDINVNSNELLNTESHEYSHFLEHNFYRVVREEYTDRKNNADYASTVIEDDVSIITKEVLWNNAQDEFNAYLKNNGEIHKGIITPLLTNKILNALDGDESLRNAAEVLKVVHDRVLLLLSLGYNSKDIAKTIYAARNMEDAHIALFRDYELDVDNLAVKKEESFFRFLRPDDLVLNLEHKQLVSRFCQSIPSVGAVRFMYSTSPEEQKEQLFELLKENYAKLKDGDQEVEQEISSRHRLIVSARRAKYIKEQLELTEGTLKGQLYGIYQQMVLGIKDFDKEVESTQRSFFDKWIKPVQEIENILATDKKIELSIRHIKLWRAFSDKDKKEVEVLFIQENFIESNGLGICINTVSEYNREKKLEILSDDNIFKQLLNQEVSEFFWEIGACCARIK
jgi:hypothetical protein